MDKDTIVARLGSAGIAIAEEDRNGDDTGWRIRTATGSLVNCYDTGTVNVQGKNAELTRTALGLALGTKAPAPGARAVPGVSRKVFVVYGHDTLARTELAEMLRRWELEPLILDQLPSGGKTIIEKLEAARKDATFAVVLATPDDEGHRAGYPGEKTFRVRQNVVLELGMMLALLGRQNVAILLKGHETERPSDIQGLIYISFKDSVTEAALTLAKEMYAQGIKIDLSRV